MVQVSPIWFHLEPECALEGSGRPIRVPDELQEVTVSAMPPNQRQTNAKPTPTPRHAPARRVSEPAPHPADNPSPRVSNPSRTTAARVTPLPRTPLPAASPNPHRTPLTNHRPAPPNHLRSRPPHWRFKKMINLSGSRLYINEYSYICVHGLPVPESCGSVPDGRGRYHTPGIRGCREYG